MYMTYTCIVYIVQCTLYSVYCTVYIVQCTLYSVHCTVYTIYSLDMYSVHCGPAWKLSSVTFNRMFKIILKCYWYTNIYLDSISHLYNIKGSILLAICHIILALGSIKLDISLSRANPNTNYFIYRIGLIWNLLDVALIHAKSLDIFIFR